MRLRFAPSPTGMLHVGNVRAGLFNWLHARRHNATLVLRIEDTDAARDKPEWIEGITETLTWLGMDWDEGPYRQSENKSLHAEAGERLFQAGAGYYCDCTREQIDERTKDSKQGYDKHCRERGLEPAEGRALRFRVPEGKTQVDDLVRGEVVFDNAVIEDFVVVRGNGAPLYLLANVVDDMSQHISHVVRGEDHLPNTPKQILLWQALSPDGEIPVPTYAHLPLLVGDSGKKLSKRRDTVAIEDFRAQGFLPQTLLNYLALLGWSPRANENGEVNEIVPVEQMIEQFDLGDVQPSPARFDLKKLANFNGHYIRELSADEFKTAAMPFISSEHSGDALDVLLPLAQSRIERLDELDSAVAFAFRAPTSWERTELKDAEKQMLAAALAEYETCEWTTVGLHETTQRVGEQLGLKLGKAQAPIRMAVTGSKVGLPLFESLEVLGRGEAIERMKKYAGIAGVL